MVETLQNSLASLREDNGDVEALEALLEAVEQGKPFLPLDALAKETETLLDERRQKNRMARLRVALQALASNIDDVSTEQVLELQAAWGKARAQLQESDAVEMASLVSESLPSLILWLAGKLDQDEEIPVKTFCTMITELQEDGVVASCISSSVSPCSAQSTWSPPPHKCVTSVSPLQLLEALVQNDRKGSLCSSDPCEKRLHSCHMRVCCSWQCVVSAALSQ